jgi:hypothetical protein
VDTLRSTSTAVSSAVLVAFGRAAYDEILGYLERTRG